MLLLKLTYSPVGKCYHIADTFAFKKSLENINERVPFSKDHFHFSVHLFIRYSSYSTRRCSNSIENTWKNHHWFVGQSLLKETMQTCIILKLNLNSDKRKYENIISHFYFQVSLIFLSLTIIILILIWIRIVYIVLTVLKVCALNAVI